MDLFSTHHLQLVEDQEGGIRYHPGFADADQAREWLDSLLRGTDWTRQRRPMYDRVVDVPRLLVAYPLDAVPPRLPLAAILEQVQATAPAPYSHVGLNLYRDGRDSVAMHNDSLQTIVAGLPIALVSLGDARRMLIRAKTGDRQSTPIELEHGSLLTMSHASQVTHEHGIPKTTRLVGERISVVFRARPGDWTE